MGGCNSSEPKSSANATAAASAPYNLWGSKNQRPGVFTLDPKGSKRWDGATENLAVHDGAILGIARCVCMWRESINCIELVFVVRWRLNLVCICVYEPVYCVCYAEPFKFPGLSLTGGW